MARRNFPSARVTRRSAVPGSLCLLWSALWSCQSSAPLATLELTLGTVERNIFSNNVQFGVRGSDSAFVSNDHNDYFGNSVGTCSQCSMGTGSLSVDPSFMDSSTDDLRLQPGSSLINSGVDTGTDVNGATPGRFNGSSPDIGAHESN